MSSEYPPHSDPIRSHDDLLGLFFESMQPRDRWKIGPELEKPGVYTSTLQPVPYAGDRGILRVLAYLQSHHGWVAERESSGGPIIALKRGGASVTLEPGGQLELSGDAANDVHAIADELDGHVSEVAPISQELGIEWLGVGFHPLAARGDFDWIPKSRYGIMREYLPTRGGHGLDMMLRTSTVQANFDYASEADAMRKMRVSLAISPLVTAMFANSPWVEGKPFGGKTFRGQVWLDVDPDRSGLLPCLWSKSAGLREYVEWALDAPMFLIKRAHTIVKNTGQTFRSFMNEGFDGHFATRSDWKMHVNTLFPEVRLKNTIEVRGADAQGPKLAPALAAFWTGVLYEEASLDAALGLVDGWSHDEVQSLRGPASMLGLAAPFRDTTVQALCERLLEIALGGLAQRNVRDREGRTEARYLEPLVSLVSRRMTPADAMLARAGLDATPEQIVQASRF